MFEIIAAGTTIPPIPNPAIVITTYTSQILSVRRAAIPPVPAVMRMQENNRSSRMRPPVYERRARIMQAPARIENPSDRLRMPTPRGSWP